MTVEQEAMVKTHLALVFKHDPDFTGMEHPAPKMVTFGTPRKLNTGEILLC